MSHDRQSDPASAARPRASALAAAFLTRGFLEASRRWAGLVLMLASLFAWLASDWYLARFVSIDRDPSIARYRGGYFAFGVVGTAVVWLIEATAGAMARHVREAQMVGTLETLLATPAPEAWVVVGLTLYDVAAGVAWFAAAVGLAALAGARLDPHAASVALALALTLAAFLSLGLWASAVTIVLRRGSPVGLLLGTLTAVFSGVLYPMDALPAWARGLGALLPTTHAIEALRGALLAGRSPLDLARPLGTLAALAVALGAPGVFALRAALRRARVDGTLGRY